MSVKTVLSVSLFAVFLAIGSIAFSIYNYQGKPSIAYVNNERILAGYKGLVETKAMYDKKMGNWQANLDTLSKEFKSDISVYQQQSGKMTSKERALKEEILRRKEQDLVNYKSALEQKAREEEAEMTAGVINQINSFIVEYGKGKGYDYIFGVTDTGNILFAKEGDDITEDVLAYLNDKYKGK